jgi:L-alanine-DL-glutamate epimerase-like enolase superfamily enzyme
MKPPPAGQALGGVGEDPDVSSHPLPIGSKRVGSGSQALGNIVSLPQTPVGIASWAAMALAIGVPIAMLLGAVRIGDLFGGRDPVYAENEG